jgi:hypothetical protein
MVSLLYRSTGHILPRDSSKQALWAHNVSSVSALLPGDPFFFSNPSVFHVMTLFAKEPQPRLFQSADNSTNNLPIEEVFGVPFDSLKSGQVLKGGEAPGAAVTFGTFFPIREWDWLKMATD